MMGPRAKKRSVPFQYSGYTLVLSAKNGGLQHFESALRKADKTDISNNTHGMSIGHGKTVQT